MTYRFGYIGTIDILGFGAFSSKKENCETIESLMKDLYAVKKTYEYNFEGKIVIMSDTIIILVEIDNSQKYDKVYFDSIVEWISMIVITIKRRIGLFSRASVTIGDYYYDDKRNILFGPGIVRGVTLTEKIDKVNEINEINHVFKERPAAIIIDNLFIRQPDQIIKQELLENLTTESIKNSGKYINIGADYFAFNPYFSEYNYISNGSNNNSIYLESFYSESLARIEVHSCKEVFAGKYQFERECLELFKRSFKNTK